MIVTFVCTTGLLITRWLYSGHLPLSNLYESFMFLSWSSSVFHIVLEVRSRDDRWLGAITVPSAKYFRSSGGNATIRNVSTRATISLVNDACKYDIVQLCNPFMWIPSINSSSSDYVRSK